MLFTVTPSRVSMSTSSEGRATAGDTYSITCTVTKPPDLTADPDIIWITSNGTKLSGKVNATQTENHTVISATTTLSPLLASDSGEYRCEMSLASPSLKAPITRSLVVTVSVQSKLILL